MKKILLEKKKCSYQIFKLLTILHSNTLNQIFKRRLVSGIENTYLSKKILETNRNFILKVQSIIIKFNIIIKSIIIKFKRASYITEFNNKGNDKTFYMKLVTKF